MTKTIIKKAGKKGEGLFALKNFNAGNIILKCNYSKRKDLIHKRDIQKLSKEDQNHLDYVGRNMYVVDYSSISKINHSCNPNAYSKYKNLKQKYVVALKPIKKGEEITVDYAIDAADNWKMKCYCGSKNCRKIIYGDYFKLPKKLQKEYWSYVPRWKKRKLN